MSARLDREKTVRARAMALPAAQQKILLAYLAGTALDKMESGLEFLASLGLADVTGAPEAEPTEPAGPPAPPPAVQELLTVVPCGDTRPHWPHARCIGIPVAPVETVHEPIPTFMPVASVDDDQALQWSCSRCDTNPVVAPGERRPGSFGHLTINATYCAACQAEATGVQFEDDGSTTLTFGDVVDAAMHPGGYAAVLAATQ